MGKKVFVIGVLFLMLTFVAVLAIGYCKPPAAHVDKNKDGVIDKKEIKILPGKKGRIRIRTGL
jgi:hypothetical protein